MASSTVEDYLKTLYVLETDRPERVTVGGVAEFLQVTPGTVTSMMKSLAKEGLVNYQPRRSVALTRKGRKMGGLVLRRHRLVESFLVEVMGLDWSEVHDEAEQLEHVISERFLERMDLMLGSPTVDPHGDPIPNREGQVAPTEARRLADMDAGSYQLARIRRDDPDLLDWLSAKGLHPGVSLELRERDSRAGLAVLKVDGKRELLRIGLELERVLDVVPAEDLSRGS